MEHLCLETDVDTELGEQVVEQRLDGLAEISMAEIGVRSAVRCAYMCVVVRLFEMDAVLAMMIY